HSARRRCVWFFFSSRRRHTRFSRDWSSDVCSSDLPEADELPLPREVVEAAVTVFDVVAVPPETPLVKFAREREIPVITGDEVIALQAALQFELYTGVTPTPEQVQRASEFSRS